MVLSQTKWSSGRSMFFCLKAWKVDAMEKHPEVSMFQRNTSEEVEKLKNLVAKKRQHEQVENL